jgi:rod shape-determining protein MreC
MNEFLQKHKDLIGVSVLLILPLVSLFYSGRDRETLKGLDRVMYTVTVPVEYVADAIYEGVASVWNGYVALVGVGAENRTLRRDVEALSGELLKLKQIELENRRIKGLCEFKASRAEYRLVSARVIGLNLSPYYRVMKIVLDRGKDDGIAVGMPVVTHRGLVGRIDRVAAGVAEVMLIVDPRSRVDVKVAEKGVSGTLVGQGRQDLFNARLLYLRKGGDVSTNDTVVTSGYDGLFPPDLEVGYVSTEASSQTGTFYELGVTPAVDFSRLSEVLVVAGRTEPPNSGAQP